MNAVPCLTWVKRGAAKRHPDKIKLTDAEIAELVQNMKTADIQDSDSDEEEEDMAAVASTSSGKRKRTETTPKKENDSNEKVEKKEGKDAIAEKYEFSDSDDEIEDDEEDNRLNLAGVAYYSSMADDPYIENKDDLDSEDEDLQVLPEDNMLAVCKVNGDICNLEVYVYNETEGNAYVHHDIILPSFPLAIEWMNFDPGEDTPGNFAAMGYMTSDIDIWDLDVIEAMEPAFVLAGKHKQKGKKKKKMTGTGHTDAVLDLSWNRIQRNVLASASADFTVGLWDLEEGVMASTISHHTEKVQTIDWHPVEPQTLLSGSFDKSAKVYDCRSPDTTHKSWNLPGEVERVIWNIHDPYYFLASSDTGHIHYLDVRTQDPVFTLSAHTAAVTGLALSSTIPGCLVTSSADKVVKVWDICDNKPQMILKKNLKIGMLHCAAPCPDSSLVFAVGGEREQKVLNLSKNSTVTSHFDLTKKNAESEAADNDDVKKEASEKKKEVSGGGDNLGEATMHSSVEEKQKDSDAGKIKKDKKKKKNKPKKNKFRHF